MTNLRWKLLVVGLAALTNVPACAGRKGNGAGKAGAAGAPDNAGGSESPDIPVGGASGSAGDRGGTPAVGGMSAVGGGGGGVGGTPSIPSAGGTAEEPGLDSGTEVTHGPPQISAASPLEGPWGTEVRISGSDLGRESRADVYLTIGEDLVLEPDDEEIVSWSESRIIFRVPFPHSGPIHVETPEGSSLAGDFPAPWRLSAALPAEIGTTVLGSISVSAGHLALLLDTDPLTVAEFDGAEWQSRAVVGPTVLPESARLYASDGTLKAFALSADPAPEIVDFALVDDEWVGTSTGVVVTPRVAVAGDVNGAVVWYESGVDEWSRARVGAGGWAVDKGPITDPNPEDELRAAGATSDGSLYLARPVYTGLLFDDTEAPFIAQLPAAANDFDSEFRVGINADDYVTSLRLVDRGRGVLVEYCGSDVDPLGVTGTDSTCFTAALTSAGLNLLSSSNEKEFRSYHAATANEWEVGLCDATAGSVLAEGEDQNIVLHLTWPCAEFGGVVVDPDGAPVVAIRYDGGFTVLLEP